MWNCSRRSKRRLEKEEFRQSESFSSLHHCTDPTGVSPTAQSHLCSGLETEHQLLLFFFFIVFEAEGQILGCPVFTLHFTFVWLELIVFGFHGWIQEKRYLCVQILTNVYLCCCLSATVEGWAGFRILNKLLFSFHTHLSFIFFKAAVLPSCHMVSVESSVLLKSFIFLHLDMFEALLINWTCILSMNI